MPAASLVKGACTAASCIHAQAATRLPRSLDTYTADRDAGGPVVVLLAVISCARRAVKAGAIAVVVPACTNDLHNDLLRRWRNGHVVSYDDPGRVASSAWCCCCCDNLKLSGSSSSKVERTAAEHLVGHRAACNDKEQHH